MGRSLPPVTQLVLQQVDEVRPLYDCLRRSDQLILDRIFEEIGVHRAAIANAANLLPLESMLILALMEERKRSIHLESVLQRLEQELKKHQPEL